ncbi:MAG: zinc-ribbon domain-containing protein [bacterium]
MIIVCQKCSSRLQVDETKVPTGSFSIRCPKCNSSVEFAAPSPALEQSAVTVGDSPATGNPRFEQPNPAPLFEVDGSNKETKPAISAADMLVELLSKLAGQSVPNGHDPEGARPSWNPRKALVCGLEENREKIARALAANCYKVFVAQDTRQAIERMRENQVDVVVLDSGFDPVEQGTVFVTREISILRPAQRRRIFFVLVSPSLRTLDPHAAFLNNVNAIINVNEVEELPRLIEHRLREYNELYRDFNKVNEVSAL